MPTLKADIYLSLQKSRSNSFISNFFWWMSFNPEDFFRILTERMTHSIILLMQSEISLQDEKLRAKIEEINQNINKLKRSTSTFLGFLKKFIICWAVPERAVDKIYIALKQGSIFEILPENMREILKLLNPGHEISMAKN